MPEDGKQVAVAPVTEESVGSSKILVALHQVMSKVGYVQKQGTNDFHKYKYAGEAHLLEVLRPAMVEAGLLLIPSGESLSPIDSHGNVFVTMHYTLAHKDGEVWPEKITVFGAGNDRNKSGGVGDKGLYKALTGANKYLLFKLFQIETGDDPEKESEADKSGPLETKSPPGISKVKIEVRDAVREINACDDGDSLRAFLPTIKELALKVCRDFEQEWIGPEEYSGLKGAIQMVADEAGVSAPVNKWLAKVEEAARTPK